MYRLLSTILFALIILTSLLFPLSTSFRHVNTCRTHCGNVSVDYPFGLKYGCGHPGYRDLLYCVNDILMFHIKSGSYRVLGIDYTYQALTLHDPHLSTCNSIVLGSRGNGFVVEPWRAPYLNPATDNAFLLIGCSRKSPLFKRFPNKQLPCKNVSGLGCEDYYRCPAWGSIGPTQVGLVSGLGPPECCAVAFEDTGMTQGINLTKLECQGYSSAYNLAPLRVDGPHEWSYGIRVKYSIQGHDEFCKTCEATGGTCGYGGEDKSGITELCFCGTHNSTLNCDSAHLVESMSMTSKGILSFSREVMTLLSGLYITMVLGSTP
ncbi:Wall-associated receptor kinase 5 [Bienertia sinuspersici]